MSLTMLGPGWTKSPSPRPLFWTNLLPMFACAGPCPDETDLRWYEMMHYDNFIHSLTCIYSCVFRNKPPGYGDKSLGKWPWSPGCRYTPDGPGVSLQRFKSRLCHLLAVWLRKGFLNSLTLFYDCQEGIRESLPGKSAVRKLYNYAWELLKPVDTPLHPCSDDQSQLSTEWQCR